MKRPQTDHLSVSLQGGYARRRGERGVSTIALVLVLVFFGLLPLALLGFELARASLVQIQLQNITDAAALGGTAVLAGGSGSDAQSSQLNAMQGALEFFDMNAVLNTQISADATGNAPLLPTSFGTGAPPVNVGVYAPTTSSATPSFVSGCTGNSQFGTGNLPVHQLWFVMTLLDSTGTPLTLSSPGVQTLQIQSSYSEAPIFLSSFLPIMSTFTVSALSYGGLPQLDLVLCFDASASMDDATPVALVQRTWNTAMFSGVGGVQWNLMTNTGTTTLPPVLSPTSTNVNGVDWTSASLYSGTGCGATDGTTCQDTIANILNISVPANVAQDNGVALNAGAPQQLEYINYQFSGIGTPGTAYEWNPPLRALQGSNQLVTYSNGVINKTNIPEMGCEPGNGSNSVQINGPPSNNSVPSGVGLAVPQNAGFNDITDMVCLLSTVKVPDTGTTYNFLSSPVVCVEASRGNLENISCLDSALNLVQTTTITNISAMADPAGNYAKLGTAYTSNSGGGWYAAYWYGVRAQQYPLAIAQQAAATFLQTMSNSSNAHFGLVTFAGNVNAANASPTAGSQIWDGSLDPGFDTFVTGGAAASNIDICPYNVNPTTAGAGTLTGYTQGSSYGYPAIVNATTANNGGNGFPLPCIALSNSTAPGSNNYQSILTALCGNFSSTTNNGYMNEANPSVVPLGSTDMADAMSQALSMIGSGRRTNSKPAVILFTDGKPDAGGGSAPDYGTFAQATAIGTAGYPCFTIGLYQNNNVKQDQLNILGDNKSYSSGMGIAYLSGNNATFNQVSASSGISGLNAAFQAIAKSLVVLQQAK